MKQTIILLDLISHENMHIPFNEGYIRVMRCAFPEDEIIFAATAGHIDNMDSTIAKNFNINMIKINNLRDNLGGKSPHSPLHSLSASRKCWHKLCSLSDKKAIRHVAVLGAVGPLIHTFSKRWKKKFKGELHFIQHDQFTRMIEWRSKNIITKYFDYLSVLSRGLPERQKLIVLELGLKDVLSKHAPKLTSSIVTIEHPVLESEWLMPKPINPKQPIKVAFLGNCGKGKGFDKFLKLAKKFTGDKYQFYGIGKNNIAEQDNLDFTGLTVQPANGHLPREDFVNLLNEVDIVCLPLPTNISYVSSGSIIDAFAGLKPLIITENQSVNAIQKKYGEYGKIIKNQDGLDTFFENFSMDEFQKELVTWHCSLEKIRSARSEQSLGQIIRETIKP
jgi:hypothetical protein